jgi:hypothetical protein
MRIQVRERSAGALRKRQVTFGARKMQESLPFLMAVVEQ